MNVAYWNYYYVQKFSTIDVIFIFAKWLIRMNIMGCNQSIFLKMFPGEKFI